MTSAFITWALTKPHGPFFYRPHFCVVPNVSWGLLHWEADVAVVTKSGWLWEVEVKVSATDWRADLEKAKWLWNPTSGALFPKRFYYAAPEKLAERYEEFGLRPEAGIVAVGADGRCRVLREPTENRAARKLTDKEMLQVARLGSMRFWRENHKRVQIQARAEAQ